MKLLLSFTIILTSFSLFSFSSFSFSSNQIRDLECTGNIVETIPIGLLYNESITSLPTFEALMGLVSSARHSIDIAAFYLTLLGTDVMPHPDEESIKGKLLLDQIVNITKTRKLKMRMVLNSDPKSDNNTDLAILKAVGEVRQINFTQLIGAGVLHTKFIIVDNQHFYVGSANMDWRALTHVKELGINVNNCSELTNDLSKIFSVYWYLGRPNAIIPKNWPKELETSYNISEPLSLSVSNSSFNTYLTSSPRSFSPVGRTTDIDGILSVINNAKQFIHIAVMDYFPQFLFSKKHEFWPVIDDALRRAVIERKIKVKLMASHWSHTRASLPLFLKSLAALNDSKVIGGQAEVKLFKVPANEKQAKIPFARVNHNKYMVTDNTALIGTSNWSADYFINTGGVSMVMINKNIDNALRKQLDRIFLRDWNSAYAYQVE